jgi:hypothetical protein
MSSSAHQAGGRADSSDTMSNDRLTPPGKLQQESRNMIRKLKSGQYRLYSRKLDPRTHKRRNLGTFDSRAAAEKHERAVQFFKRRG